MELDELKQAILATDPAAVLVAPRILRRVLQAQFNVPYMLVHVPHERCYVFDRQVVFQAVEQDELELEPDRLLPSIVILLARPSPEALQTRGRDAILSRYWRLLFHAHIHLALQHRMQEGRLTADDVQTRIERIGRSEFEEIRSVLQQENGLLPPQDDLSVYVEFAAVYLELRYFRTNLRGTYFPALRDFQAIDQLLALDVDAETLFARTRLQGAPNPVILTDTSSDESQDYYWRLMRSAERAGREGDVVRAAVIRTRAARVAPVALTQETRSQARRDLESLTRHLQDAIKFSDEEADEWLQILPALLDKADQGPWPVEAKLLYDLQKVCLEYERKLYALDLVEWLISAGKRPIKRPLSSLQIVHTTKHLRSAAVRLTMARVSDEDRRRLAKLLQNALRLSEARLRDRFRPILVGAFYDAGLVAGSSPEQVSLHKMIEELLDRITEYGFFTFSDLRDTVSRNQLKLPDLPDPYAFWQGDPLLRLDRRLAALLEGVYRRGEFYLRWLESCSSLFFGTNLGRILTTNFVVPFGGALALLGGFELCVRDYGGQELNLPWYAFVLLGFFLLALIRLGGLREFFHAAGTITYRTIRQIAYVLPRRLWHLPWVQRLFRSWPLLLFYWYGLKPLAVTGALCLYWPEQFATLPAAGLTFLVADVILNSRFGYAMSEALLESTVVIYGWLRFDVLQGIVRVISQFFKRITETVQYLLYSVDEWLRFRSDESQLTMIARAVLGVVWFPVGNLIRLYFLVLIEPTINPLKLPLSILAAKFLVLIPVYRNLVYVVGSQDQWALIHDQLAPHTGLRLAVVLTYTVIVPTLWLAGSGIAFLLWEMQENWRLFRANRSPRLRPVVVGRHGETLLQLLKPGAHSGTIPKLFAQLRRAERGAYRTGNWRAARTYRQALHEVAISVQVFIERELLELLQQSKGWGNQPLHVGQVLLSCNRIRIELVHAAFPEESVWLALEQRSGWLLSRLQGPGWLRHVSAAHAQIFTTALAGIYKIAGVDIVHEQLASLLPPGVPGYDLTDQELVVWTNRRNGSAIAYDLGDGHDQLRPRRESGEILKGAQVLQARRLFFSRVPLTWQEWVEFWQKDHEGQGYAQLLSDSLLLVPAERAHMDREDVLPRVSEEQNPTKPV
ncbi:MAG TPA: hypothetical protein VKU02_25600 [Gemmataceae bacterium]|nr:hypothetical protein [Gemmataceae bacterium]